MCYNTYMISTYTYKKLTWVDVTSPTQEEIIRLSETYNLPALVGEEMMGDTLRSKVDVYNKLIYLVLHFPRLRLDAKNELPPEQEIDQDLLSYHPQMEQEEGQEDKNLPPVISRIPVRRVPGLRQGLA